MFVMRLVMFAGHLLEHMIRLFCCLTSLMLPGVLLWLLVLLLSYISIHSALLATALFDREANCRKAASVSDRSWYINDDPLILLGSLPRECW